MQLGHIGWSKSISIVDNPIAQLCRASRPGVGASVPERQADQYFESQTLGRRHTRSSATRFAVEEAYQLSNKHQKLRTHGRRIWTAEVDPDNVDSLLNRGVTHLNQEEIEAAVREFSGVISLRPGDAAAHLNRGIALTCQDRYEEALGDFDRAVAIDPEDAESYYERGSAPRSA